MVEFIKNKIKKNKNEHISFNKPNEIETEDCCSSYVVHDIMIYSMVFY